MLHNNQESTLDRLQKMGQPAYGLVVDAQISVGQTTARWRNNTNSYVFLTGLYSEKEDSQPAVSIQVDSNDITGGFVPAGAIFTNNGGSVAPTTTWVGAIVVPPMGILTTSLDAAATDRFQYTAVIAPVMKECPEDWPEPRWIQVAIDNTTGQQDRDSQLPYNAVLMDVVRGNVDAFLATTLIDLFAEDTPLTATTVTALAIPRTTTRPNLIFGIPMKAGYRIWVRVRVQTVATNPIFVFRLMKRWGDNG